jgi:hypothetical protein
LHRVDHAERVALERQRDLEDARAQSRFQWRVVSAQREVSLLALSRS